MTPDSSTVLQILHNRGPLTPDEIYLLLDSSGPWLYSNISYLRRNGWIVAELPKEIENSNGVFPDTKISITEKGKEALYDHLNREKIERKISIQLLDNNWNISGGPCCCYYFNSLQFQ